MTDPDPLSKLLDHWQPDPGAAPHFASAVHRRISAQPVAVPERRSMIAQIIAWPASLPLAAAFAVIIGVASALSMNRSRDQAFMADAYARSIDPIRLSATSDLATHPHLHQP